MEEMNKEQKEQLKQELKKKLRPVIVGSITIAGAIGFVAGSRYAERRIGSGLNLLLVADPTLEKTMLAALDKVKSVVSK